MNHRQKGATDTMSTRARESTVERFFTDTVRSRGWDSFKFVSPGTRGVPDRILLIPDHRGRGAVTLFVEIKRPGERPRASQRATFARMRACGATIVVVDSSAAVERLVTLLENCSGLHEIPEHIYHDPDNPTEPADSADTEDAEDTDDSTPTPFHFG